MAEETNTEDSLTAVAERLGIQKPERLSGESDEEYQKRWAQKVFDGAHQDLRKEKQGILWDLLDKDLDLVAALANLVDVRDRSLFIACVEDGDPTIVEKLYKNKVGIDRRDRQENTALHVAVAGRHSSLVPLLTGRFLNSQNSSNHTALHTAVLAGDSQSIQALIAEGANRELEGLWKGRQVTPLAMAVMEGYTKCIDTLQNGAPRGARLQDRLEGGGTLLHLSIEQGMATMLSDLLTRYPTQMRPLLDSRDSRGRTPVALASSHGDVDAVNILLQAGASKETKDDDGNTPLHLATLGMHDGVVNLLVYEGARTDERNKPTETHKKGQTVHDLIFELRQRGENTEPIVHAIDQALRKIRIRDQFPWDYVKNPPENLIFGGGGVRGLALVGALTTLESKDMLNSVRRVAGTSAGAIASTLFAVGYTPKELKEIFQEFEANDYFDAKPGLESMMEGMVTGLDKGSVLAGIGTSIQTDPTILLRPDKLLHFLWKGATGICKGDKILGWINLKIAKKVADLTGRPVDDCMNLTFGELHDLAESRRGEFKHLHVFAIRFSTQADSAVVRFSSEDTGCRNKVIAHAVRCSMSIPTVFEPAHIYVKEADGTVHVLGMDQYVDGGLLYNVPIDGFDPLRYQTSEVLSESEQVRETTNRKTLGLVLYETGESQGTAIKTTRDLVGAIADVVWNRELGQIQSKKSNEERIIYIPVSGVGIVSKIDDDIKETLFQLGSDAVRRRIERMEAPRAGEKLGLLPGSNLSPLPGHLVARRKQSEVLNKAIVQPGLSKKVFVLHIMGNEGSGKTSFVRRFVTENSSKLSVVFGIDCSSYDSLIASYESFAKVHGLERSGTAEQLVEVVNKFLEQPRSKPWLMIIDNAPGPKDVGPVVSWWSAAKLPSKGGGILTISPHDCQLKGCNETVVVNRFSKDEALQLMGRVTGCPVDGQMKGLAQQLDYHPMSIFLAAQHIKNRGTSVDVYRKRVAQHLPKNPKNSAQILWAVWSVLAEDLEAESPLALEFIRVCAYLDWPRVPLGWLSVWKGYREGGFREKDASDLEKVLRRDGVTQSDSAAQGRLLTFHPSLLRVVRRKDEDRMKEAVDLLIAMKLDMVHGTALADELAVKEWERACIRIVEDRRFERYGGSKSQELIRYMMEHGDDRKDRSMVLAASNSGIRMLEARKTGRRDERIAEEYQALLRAQIAAYRNGGELEKALLAAQVLMENQKGNVDGVKFSELVASHLDVAELSYEVGLKGRDRNLLVKAEEKASVALTLLDGPLGTGLTVGGNSRFTVTGPRGSGKYEAMLVRGLARVALAELEENQLLKKQYVSEAIKDLGDVATHLSNVPLDRPVMATLASGFTKCCEQTFEGSLSDRYCPPKDFVEGVSVCNLALKLTEDKTLLGDIKHQLGCYYQALWRTPLAAADLQLIGRKLDMSNPADQSVRAEVAALAIANFNQALTFRQSNGDYLRTLETYSEIIRFYEASVDYDPALQMIVRAAELAWKMDDSRVVAELREDHNRIAGKWRNLHPGRRFYPPNIPAFPKGR